jgi:hypothetical protein
MSDHPAKQSLGHFSAAVSDRLNRFVSVHFISLPPHLHSLPTMYMYLLVIILLLACIFS